MIALDNFCIVILAPSCFSFFLQVQFSVIAWEQNGLNSPNLIQLTVQPNGVTYLLTNSAPANYQQYWTTSGLTQAQVIAVGLAINDLLSGCNGFAGCAGEADGCVAYTAATAAPAGTWPPNCVSCECPMSNRCCCCQTLPMRNSLSNALGPT